MVNFLELNPTLLTGGSPTRQDFEDLSASGCEVVINLALPTSSDSLPNEAEEVAGLGMEYISIPVIWETPTRRNLTDFFEAFDHNQHHKVFVHCVKNMRVSAFIYLYRLLRQGWSPHAARPDLVKIWEPAGTWAAFIEEMLTNQQDLP
jgi:protein tyrosine phosphatase (PTP) superfamily phosphohydrolase (DUF442 family)